jgi:hypothetical protein
MKASLASYPGNGLFIASLDHSPSEQLTGATWHTTALILSPAVEHDALATQAAAEFRTQRGSLVRWNRATDRYRSKFLPAFLRLLNQHLVLAVCFCAREETILREELRFTQELGIQHRYSKAIVGGKARTTLGPFTRIRGADVVSNSFSTVSSKQALMALFVARNLHITRDCMQDELMKRSPDGGHVWWQFFADRPPNNFDGPLGDFTNILLNAQSHERGSKRFAWGGFASEGQEIDLLADNLAGAVNSMALAGLRQSEIETLGGLPVENFSIEWLE